MPILSADLISRRFGGVVALDHASFTCEAGEIHALLGGNGAGKSTMVKIICGVLPPDEGEIFVNGDVVAFHKPTDAAAVGIIPVFQELSLIPDLTVAENIYLGREPRRFGLVDRGSMRRQTVQLLASLHFPAVDPDVTVRDLPLADRQLIEIAKAISQEPDILVLDEATSALSSGEVARLFHILRRLRDQGIAVVFISHRMEEVFDLCDRATVFRNGRDVGTIDVAKTRADEVVKMMVGRDLIEVFPPKPPRPPQETPALEVHDLSWNDVLHAISFTVNKGEIVGLGGLEGQGQGDLLFALFGAYAAVEGTVKANGEPVSLQSPHKAMMSGIAMVPEDRKTQGLILPLSVKVNMSMAILPEIATLGVIHVDLEAEVTDGMVEQLSIKTADTDLPVRFLSGGNQQKTSIAKWLLTEAGIYLMYDPTRGIDVGTKQELYRLLRELADEGAAILLFSTDSSEIIGLCDRALVMYEGGIAAQLQGEEITRENLISESLGLQTGTVSTA